MALGILMHIKKYDELEPYQQKTLFFMGIAFLIILAALVVFDVYRGHEHGIMEITFYTLLFVFGVFLIMPRMALKFLAAIPLPPFLRRNDKPSLPPDHSDSESDGGRP